MLVILVFFKAFIYVQRVRATCALYVRTREERQTDNPSATRTLTINMYHMDVSSTWAFFALPLAGLFSCSRSGTQEARVNTGCKRGPWPRSVARALGVQSRENWQITTGSLSGQLEPTRPMQTRKTTAQFPPHVVFSFPRPPPHVIFSFFVSGCCYGTTAALQAFPFMTAKNGAFGCRLESVRVRTR